MLERSPAKASGAIASRLPSQVPPMAGKLVTLSQSPHPHSGWAFPQPLNGNTHNESKGWVNDSKSGLRLKACSHTTLWKSKCKTLILGVGFIRTPQTTPARGIKFGVEMLN